MNKAAYLAAFLKEKKIYRSPVALFMHKCLTMCSKGKICKRGNFHCWHFMNLKSLFISVYSTFTLYNSLWKALDMQICTDVSQCVCTRSSWPTSVKPSFPAWKALRVNSPASAGLMPGTLPEKHSIQTRRNAWGTRCACIRHTQHTHKQRRIKRRVNVSLRVHLEWKQARLRRLKRWRFHCFHNHFSSLIRRRQWWAQNHLANGGHDLLTGAKYSVSHSGYHLTDTVATFHLV